MGKVPATEFKARCLELMDRVAERSESFVITKRGRPVAKLVPVATEARRSIFGALQGQARTSGDVVSPLAPSSWATLQEWDELQRPKGARGGRRRRTAGRAR
jgi:prevent-host-death family protein